MVADIHSLGAYLSTGARSGGPQAEPQQSGNRTADEPTTQGSTGTQGPQGSGQERVNESVRQQPAQEARPEEGPAQREEVEQAVSNLSEFVQNVRRELNFSIDDESGHTVVKVINSQTDEVIRQIPPEEVLAIARNLQESGDGLLLRTKA